MYYFKLPCAALQRALKEMAAQPTADNYNKSKKAPSLTADIRARLFWSNQILADTNIVTLMLERYQRYLHPGISVSSFRGGTVSNVLAYFLAACLCACRASISFLVLGIRHLKMQHRVITDGEGANMKKMSLFG